MFKSLKGEFLGIFNNKKLLVAIFGILVIPLLYSAVYLWAFWDPYAHVERMPVAVVNHDEGAEYKGKRLAIGDDLVERLKDKESFHYSFVSEKNADRGLQNEMYYLKIEIPKDFSKNATTLQDDKPKSLNLIYTPNEGTNYLSAKIGDAAVEKMKEEVSAAVTKTYAESMFTTIKDVSKGLGEAGSGAGDLNKGIHSAKNGTGGLHEGIDSAKKGTGDLDNGIRAARDGADQVSKGAGDAHSGAKEIQSNLKTLAERSVTFSNGLNSASAGSKDLDEGLKQFSTGLGQMKNGQTNLLEGAKETQAGAGELSDGVEESLKGFADIQGKLPQITEGANLMAKEANALAGNLNQWSAGANETKYGAAEVSGGLKDVLQHLREQRSITNDAQQKAQIDQLIARLEPIYQGSTGVAAGVGQLSSSANEIAAAGSSQFKNGAAKLEQGQMGLSDGIDGLAAGQQKLAKGASELESGQDELIRGLSSFGDKIGEAQMDLNQLSQGSSALTSGLGRLAERSGQMENGTARLAEGSKQLADGTGRLSEGSTELAGGMGQLSEGSAKLEKGMDKLSHGSANLENGMSKLEDGSKELSDKLKDGAKDAEDVKANDDVYDMFAKPVDLKENRVNKVPNYGTAFAPYFLSLSLYIGALVLSIIFPLRNPAVTPNNGFNWFAGKWGVMLTVGVFQALLADFALLQWLGLEVKSVPYLILFSILTSWTYLAIIQFLVTAFDNPGRFVAILVLIMQLTSSAGTFPIELTPKLFQAISQYLPMTYSVAGFRNIISTGNYDFVWHNIGRLGIFFAVFILLTLGYFLLTYKKMKHVFGRNLERAKS
ncbi:YhgE/Pip domain-containing protein [Peribacillus glennii]|uniref:YhgE/Pip domain-containing protein n=1 Tax=Peribacillus glennii TaxID=2303991 RepID=A0A372LI45_9BACI|nr:YhgE/Pip domain-containing protein [Peribacillus glennii]RFU65296.1 YhgE/Pip domain-containing protein [Peribacillus glennii]